MSNHVETKGSMTYAASRADPASAARPPLMLGLATAGFAVNFWAWALLSPLGPKFRDVLHLSPFAQALVVAVPVVVGSLGLAPAGKVGSVTGVVGAAGGLGGFIPPLVMGLVYGQFHSHAAGLAALAVIAAALSLAASAVRTALTARTAT